MIQDFYNNNTNLGSNIALNTYARITKKAATRKIPRIFLIDDDPLFISMMQRSAKKFGITLYTCCNAEEINITKQNDYDLAIIDYNLGNTTGIDIANYLSHFNGAVPTIIISQSLEGYKKEINYPKYIENYILKAVGIENILKEALKVFYNHNKKIA